MLNRGRVPSAELALKPQRHVKGQQAPCEYPRWIEFIEELATTTTGKIRRFELRAGAA